MKLELLSELIKSLCVCVCVTSLFVYKPPSPRLFLPTQTRPSARRAGCSRNVTRPSGRRVKRSFLHPRLKCDAKTRQPATQRGCRPEREWSGPDRTVISCRHLPLQGGPACVSVCVQLAPARRARAAPALLQPGAVLHYRHTYFVLRCAPRSTTPRRAPPATPRHPTPPCATGQHLAPTRGGLFEPGCSVP